MKTNHVLGLLVAFLAIAVAAVWAPWSASPLKAQGDVIVQGNAGNHTSTSSTSTTPASKSKGEGAHHKLHVTVRNQLGSLVEGARLGFAFASIDESGVAEREQQTDSSGSAVFEFEESELQNHDYGVCTVSLLTPSNPPQVQEIRLEHMSHTPVRFTQPKTGSVRVHVTQSNGLLGTDGTEVFLQLAEGSFRPSIGQSVLRSVVKDGVASFSGVGLDTKLTAATWDPVADEYVADSFRGPVRPLAKVAVHLMLSGPGPEVLLRIHGEDLGNGQSMAGTLTWRIGRDIFHGVSFDPSLDQLGLAKLELSRSLPLAEVALLTVAEPPKVSSNSPGLRVGFRLLYEKTLTAGLREWLVPFASDVIVSGRVVDLQDKPYAGCALRFVVSEVNPKRRQHSLSMYWDFESGPGGLFRIDAPNIASLKYEVLQRDLQQGFTGAEGLAFMPGEADVVFEIPRERVFVGRLLVDDPKYLSKLTIGYYRENGGPVFFNRFFGHFTSSDGSFRVWPGRGFGRDLIVSSALTGEHIAVLPQNEMDFEKDGEVWRMPDWDLRGKIFEHKVLVRNSDGGFPGEVALSLPTVEENYVLYTEPSVEFLAPSAQMLLYVNAAGCREQKVMSVGSVKVKLTKGLPLHVKFDPPLPDYYGVQWQIGFLRASSPVDDENLLWSKVRGKEATLSMPAVGDYAVLLRGSTSTERRSHGEETMNTVVGDWSNPLPLEIVEGENQITVSCSEEEFATVVWHVRNPDGRNFRFIAD